MSALAPVLVALVWAAVIVFVVVRTDTRVRAVIAAWERVKTPTASAALDIPNDLEALVMSQSELWAQEDVSKAIRERYEEYGGDWNKVRSAFGLGALS